MEKKFYTFEEILLALRTEYLEHQKQLEELKKCLTIECDGIKDFYFDSHYKLMYYDKVVHDKHLSLVVVERLNVLKKIYEKLLRLSGYSYPQNKLFYNVDTENLGHFNLEHKDMLVNINPTINITNQTEFNKLVSEILNTDFMNLSEQQVNQPMIDGWNLRIYNSLIYLGNYYKSVFYDPKYDTIKFRGIDYNDGALSLIKSPIAEFYIGDDIKMLINRNLQEGKTIEISEYNFNKKETNFDVEDNDKGLKLIKRKHN